MSSIAAASEDNGGLGMNIDGILLNLWKNEEKNILITDEDGRVVYESAVMECPVELFLSKLELAPEDDDEWELLDKTKDAYFRVKRTAITEDGKSYTCYSFTDVSEYTRLTRDVLSYTKGISNMSKFQTAIMKQLSMSYDAFLPGLAEYCSAKKVVMYIRLVNSPDYFYKSVYDGELVRTHMEPDAESEKCFALAQGEKLGEMTCILNSGEQDTQYVVLAYGNGSGSIENGIDISVHNVVRLFIENSIMRESIVYESEHDKLTGLYNKGKYMALKKENFGNPETIAIFNFDVNNLKYINDNFGHELGDRLIVMAASSIRAVCGDKVMGFRMGGDEYLMLAKGLNEEDADALLNKWRDELGKLNEADELLHCVMACGMVYGSGDYDYDELYAKADELMYEEKRRLKSEGFVTALK